MSPGKKKGLGRGLSALFGDESPKEKTSITNQNNQQKKLLRPGCLPQKFYVLKNHKMHLNQWNSDLSP